VHRKDSGSPSATSMSAKRCGGRAASVRSADAETSAENTLEMSNCTHTARNRTVSCVGLRLGLGCQVRAKGGVKYLG